MGLKDKAKNLNFDGLPEPPKDGGASSGAPRETPTPKTAPGMLMAFAIDRKTGLLAENEQLKSEAEALRSRLDAAVEELGHWEGARATRLLDPKRVARSRYANRHELNFTGPEFEAFCAEISAAGGNVEPIKVRPVQRPDADYEVVYGHRRHAACLQVGLPVLAFIDNVDDQNLFVEMERENRERRDLSPWEQGMSYQRALDLGLFPSNRRLADAIGRDLGDIGKALTLARLPAAVVDAFPSPMDLQYRWAKPLSDALAKDPDGVLARAKAAKERRGQMSASAVLEMLVGGGTDKGAGPSRAPEIAVKDGRKQVAIVSVDRLGKTVVKFDVDLDDSRRSALAELIKSFLAMKG